MKNKYYMRVQEFQNLALRILMYQKLYCNTRNIIFKKNLLASTGIEKFQERGKFGGFYFEKFTENVGALGKTPVFGMLNGKVYINIVKERSSSFL